MTRTCSGDLRVANGTSVLGILLVVTLLCSGCAGSRPAIITRCDSPPVSIVELSKDDGMSGENSNVVSIRRGLGYDGFLVKLEAVEVKTFSPWYHHIAPGAAMPKTTFTGSFRVSASSKGSAYDGSLLTFKNHIWVSDCWMSEPAGAGLDEAQTADGFPVIGGSYYIESFNVEGAKLSGFEQWRLPEP